MFGLDAGEVCGYMVCEGTGAQRGKFEEREITEDIISS